MELVETSRWRVSLLQPSRGKFKVVVGHTSPTQVRYGGMHSLESKLKSHAGPETTEVKMDSARVEEIRIRL